MPSIRFVAARTTSLTPGVGVGSHICIRFSVMVMWGSHEFLPPGLPFACSFSSPALTYTYVFGVNLRQSAIHWYCAVVVCVRGVCSRDLFCLFMVLFCRFPPPCPPRAGPPPRLSGWVPDVVVVVGWDSQYTFRSSCACSIDAHIQHCRQSGGRQPFPITSLLGVFESRYPRKVRRPLQVHSPT